MDFSRISEQLADIQISAIGMFAFVLTIIRLGLVRSPTAAARAFTEVIEAALIAVVLVFMIIQPFVMKSFYIPTGSMLPTLVDNDHIVVNKLLYRVAKPSREDVVVFVAPPQALLLAPEGPSDDDSPTNYIKRLIGVSGDVIEVHHGYITVGGEAASHGDIRRNFNLDDPDEEHVKIEQNDIICYNNGWKRYGAADIASAFDKPGAPVTFHPGYVVRNGQA
jgi:signal peptidase I